MTHLLVHLLTHHDPLMLTLVVIDALVGAGLAIAVLSCRVEHAGTAGLRLGAFGVITAGFSFAAFAIALKSAFPQIDLNLKIHWIIGPIAVGLLFSVTSAAIHLHLRRSLRNAMLAGSLLACGVSLMFFGTLNELVKPFHLAYDLTGVIWVTVLGSALLTFALWEQSRRDALRAWLAGIGLAGVALVVLTVGSVASVLPFDAWMSAISRPNDLAFSPMAVLVAAEAIVCLVLSLLGSLLDHQVAARDQLEATRLRQLADSAFEGILIHRGGIVIDGNRSVAALIGAPLESLLGQPLARFLPGEDIGLASAGEEAETRPLEAGLKTFEGKELPVELLSRQIMHRGEPATVSAVRDIRERREAENRIRFLAHHDMLTELPNRVLLRETLEFALRLSGRTNTPLAVLCLDLDGFKLVNDTQGHAAGDELLRHVADRLRHALRRSDFVARVGGDEFVILLTADVSVDSCVRMARRLIERLSASFTVQNQRVNVGTSIGIAMHPQDGDDAAALLERADIALYRAKESGRGWFSMFEIGMDRAMNERRLLEADLRLALSHNELSLVYQPLFDPNGTVTSFEALMRWTHPSRGAVSPMDFIPLAEECGLIIQLGEWALRQACREAQTWSSSIRVAVNLSPIQILRGNLAQSIADILAETGLAPGRLELEITEGVLMDNTEHALATLVALRALGTRLVLDDFGTGYSSLSYLHRFPIDKLKVDRSFVQRIEGDESSRAIVNAIISMSRNLNLQVTAEGVETVPQLTMLREQGCHELQGFLLGRPIPRAAVLGFIAEHVLPAPLDKPKRALSR